MRQSTTVSCIVCFQTALLLVTLHIHWYNIFKKYVISKSFILMCELDKFDKRESYYTHKISTHERVQQWLVDE